MSSCAPPITVILLLYTFAFAHNYTYSGPRTELPDLNPVK